MRHVLFTALLVAACALSVIRIAEPVSSQPIGADPLPSWHEGPVKQAIIDFITDVTREGSPHFVPVAERIATFDNDGTLWAEMPLPNEVYFLLARLRELADQDPSLRERQPFKAALEGDAAYFHEAPEETAVELVLTTYSGMSQEQFADEAHQFFRTGRHPVLNRPFTATVYQPMLELLAYLRANGFETWLCSGGTVDFMRVFAPQTYGIPPEQVIGSVLKRDFRLQDGRWMIWRLPALVSFNDTVEKPVNIDGQVGQRPVFVAGNVRSGGDIAQMEYSKGRPGPSFQLLINHDDAEREFAYQEPDNASLNAAAQYGFTVVNIKREWKTVFVSP